MGADGVPEYRDAKDWTGWPPLDSPEIWKADTLGQATRQAEVIASLGVGGRVVWKVSSPEAAEVLSKLFEESDLDIEVRHVP